MIFLNTFLWQISNAIEHRYVNWCADNNASLLFGSDKLYRSLFRACMNCESPWPPRINPP